MKKHITPQEEADKVIFTQLKTAHMLLKNFQVNKALDILEQFSGDALSPGLQVYALHLEARCKLQEFEKNWLIYDLQQADRLLTRMVKVAYNNFIKLRNPNYLFTRAIVKFNLGNEHEDADLRLDFAEHAKRLVRKGREFYPDHAGFAWLEEQLNQAA